jgi:hypothetical protein
VNDVNKALQDAAYVAVGLGVIGFHKAQVRRHELAGLVKSVDERLVPVRGEIESRLEELEGRLPDPAKELVRTARLLAKDAETQVRKLVGVA